MKKRYKNKHININNNKRIFLQMITTENRKLKMMYFYKQKIEI